MKTAKLAPVVLVALAAAGPGLAQDPPAPTPAPSCAAQEHRQFDFWIGVWRVEDAGGRFQGTNRIEPILGGCVLQESWSGAGGSRGHSFNIYSKGRGRWHQTWVDGQGLLLLLDGGLVDGSMVLEGTTTAGDGAAVRHRISWTPLADGRVRQHWQSSRDGGTTWSDAFDGYYSRMPG